MPERRTLLAIAASGMTGFWVVGSVLGLHPDGAILGFSGTMWAVWATVERAEKHKYRRHGKPPHEKGEEEPWEE